MFAIFIKGNYVVKLPKERVEELICSGDGLPYDPGNGKIMKEWVIIPEEYANSAKPLTLYPASNNATKEVSIQISLLFKVLSKLFRKSKIFSIRSTLIHSTKIFKKTICVITFTLKFINYFVTFVL